MGKPANREDSQAADHDSIDWARLSGSSKMRCDEVMREMQLPSDERDVMALARHFSECRACARWSEYGAEFHRLWDATRPAEVPAESWDRVWAGVSDRLLGAAPEHSKQRLAENRFAQRNQNPLRPTAVSPLGSDWRKLAAVGLVGLAQAAALLLAVAYYWKTPQGSVENRGVVAHHDAARRTAPSLDSEIDVEWGQVLVVRSEGSAVQVTDLSAAEPSNGEDPWYVFFNRLESASSVVAMTE
jgi:hypothetical protein